MANKKTSTKKTTKKPVKKVTKKPVKKVVKEEVKETVVEEVKVEKVEKKEEVKSEKHNKKYLIIAILYLLCSIIWFTGSISKLLIEESYKFDIIVSILLLIASCIYFVFFYFGGRKPINDIIFFSK